MRYCLSAFIFLLFLGGFVFADTTSPGWFVVKSNSQANRTPDIEKKQAHTSDTKEEEVNNNKNIHALTKQEPFNSDFSLHFARADKDYLIAQKLLKHKFEQNYYENFIVSPLTFYIASIILANGSVDETLLEFSQLFSVLRLSSINRQMTNYLKPLKSSISIHTSLWGKYFTNRFQTIAKTQFGTEAWNIDNSTKPINDWADVRSNGKIRNIAPDADISDNEIISANIAYIHGTWQIPFSIEQTQKEDFEGIGGQKSKILMMHQKARVPYFEDENIQAIRLSYIDGSFITIFLPKDIRSFEKFVNQINVQRLKINFNQEKDVDIYIPKFEIESTTTQSLAIFQLFGIAKIFENNNYEFAKMVSFDNPVNIKDVLFKTKIIVDEGNDTKKTTQNHLQTNNQSDAIIFKANHPFIFMINNADFIGLFCNSTPS